MSFNYILEHHIQTNITYFIAVIIRSDLILDSSESNVTVQKT